MRYITYASRGGGGSAFNCPTAAGKEKAINIKDLHPKCNIRNWLRDFKNKNMLI